MLEWVTETIYNLGYVGIGFLMFLENLFPPIPSELIMPLAGFVVQQGKMDFTLVVLAGVVGTVLGTLPWYYTGRLLGEKRLTRFCDRYGKWIGISGEDISKATRWFDHHGNKAVLFCRLVPGVRTLISIPAGIGNMELVAFLVYSKIGTTLWVGLLAYAGFILGQNYKVIEGYIDPVSKVVAIVIIGTFLGYVLVKFTRKNATR
ncbi:putative membrane-associated protein [Synechococcus sp. PCC 7502]|uniref:DedA family protein n=1 Tax=Synechococcus sp. PCC 7502 TaxID=1173263 RepID=UPI00029FBC07|nr:DedA family protein [Synechococcus sp. PCC 7502]AFY73624.1 putative membrane-associated protein [Synechococcus sp. PCC 7502]